MHHDQTEIDPIPPNNASRHYVNELKRKGFHFLSAGIPIGYYLTDYMTSMITIGSLLGIAIVTEYLRFYSSRFNEIFDKIFGSLLRDEEKTGYSGATYLLISSFLVIMIFHKEIAILCLLFLVFGDGFAAVIGKKFGRTRLFGKTIEGSLAFAVVSIAVSFVFPYVPFAIRLTGALIAALVEILPMQTSDNLRIPIISGSIMEIMYVQSQRETDLFNQHEILVHWFSVFQ